MMQTTIKDIKQDVVTTGMPFFDFEHYAFNQLFPKEDYSDHILMKQIPVSRLLCIPYLRFMLAQTQATTLWFDIMKQFVTVHSSLGTCSWV